MGVERDFTRVGIGWQIGAQSGWGTYGVNLALELVRKGIEPALFMAASQLYVTRPQAELLRVPNMKMREWNAMAMKGAKNGGYETDFPIVHALGDKLVYPNRLNNLKGHPNAGAVFFESADVPAENIEAAKIFDVIITGSGWNAKVLENLGMTNVRNCPQGVDIELFKPGPRQNRFPDRFTVFSGGKLEYRKGQDIVVAAFKQFHARHPEALFVPAWNSPWPETAKTIKASQHVTGLPNVDANNHFETTAWLSANGIPPDAVADPGLMANAGIPGFLREMDLAIFPNRCEGGTNLAAMECMATGVPCVISRNTGHLDLIGEGNCYVLEDQGPCVSDGTDASNFTDWGESSVEELLEKMEQAYADKSDRERRGAAGAAFMQGWSWSIQVDRLLDALAAFR